MKPNPPRFHQITPHIFRLDLRWWGISVCVWMVKNEDSWVLIDTGPPGGADLLAALEDFGVAPQYVVLTHGHPDHLGGLNEVLARWKLPILCHSSEASFIRGEAEYASLNAKSPFYHAIARTLPQPKFPLLSLQFLEDGAVWGQLETVHIPGHSPGHLALLHSEDRALLCADAFRFKPWGALPVWNYNREMARDSMRKLASLDFDHLLPSHGRAILGSGRLKAQMAARNGR